MRVTSRIVQDAQQHRLIDDSPECADADAAKQPCNIVGVDADATVRHGAENAGWGVGGMDANPGTAQTYPELAERMSGPGGTTADWIRPLRLLSSGIDGGTFQVG